MSDWPKRRWGPFDVPHPDSPAGRDFDYSALDVPHPNSPAGRNFDYSSSLGVAHPNSPAGRSGLWLGGDFATNEREAREGIQETILTDRVAELAQRIESENQKLQRVLPDALKPVYRQCYEMAGEQQVRSGFHIDDVLRRVARIRDWFCNTSANPPKLQPGGREISPETASSTWTTGTPGEKHKLLDIVQQTAVRTFNDAAAVVQQRMDKAKTTSDAQQQLVESWRVRMINRSGTSPGGQQQAQPVSAKNAGADAADKPPKAGSPPAPPATKAHLTVEVKTPLGKPVVGATVHVSGLPDRKTAGSGIADFGEVEPKSYDITAAKTHFGPPPAAGNPLEFKENQIGGFPAVAGKNNIAQLQLMTVEAIKVSHTPLVAATPIRIYKKAVGDTDVEHEIVATVTAPVKAGTGAGTQAKVKVQWTFKADAGNCPKAKNGKDDTSVHFVQQVGFGASGDMKTKAETVTNDAGETKIIFSASAVAGDKFTVIATVVDGAATLVSGQSPTFEVWKLLDYKGLFMMETAAQKGQDVGAICTVAKIQPGYTPCFTEYKMGAVTKIAFKEFISTLDPPTAAQQAANSAVRVVSDGPDTRQVKVRGLVVAADGTVSAGSETVTLNGTTQVTGITKFQRVDDISATADAQRTVTIDEADGAHRAIATLAKSRPSVAASFRFDTDAAVKTKADSWKSDNETKMATDAAALKTSIGHAGHHLVGAAFFHPKNDGRKTKTSFYPAYPAVRIMGYGGGTPVHPDEDWSDVPGFNLDDMSIICLNATSASYQVVVGRHEIGHAADAEPFGVAPADVFHCPQASCLMFFQAQQNAFCTIGTDHSQKRMKGWKR